MTTSPPSGSETGELLPCPFCGGGVENVSYFGNYNRPESWCVHCAECDISLNGDATKEAAAKRWNTRAQPQAGEADYGSWEDDPSSDERWNAGVDFAMKHFCKVLGVEPDAFSWDAATETVDGDVMAVIGNMLRAKYGEDWGPDRPTPSETECDQTRGESAALAKALEDLLGSSLAVHQWLSNWSYPFEGETEWIGDRDLFKSAFNEAARVLGEANNTVSHRDDGSSAQTVVSTNPSPVKQEGRE